MRIAEVYRSLQGEGALAGTPSVFVRTSGCNLRCVWCDTPFTSWQPIGDEMGIAAILQRVTDLGGGHAVITGGEPLLMAECPALCRMLRRAGWHVTIETAGTILPPSDPTALADLMSISPKLASSGPPPNTPRRWQARHEAARRSDDVLTALMKGPHQLKFVIDTPADLAEASRWIDDLAHGGGPVDLDQVFMMPQGRTPALLAATAEWLRPACLHHGYQFAPRHHIAWFGDTRGT
jgi:7-carboxy-7-deazaguanine synthase